MHRNTVQFCDDPKDIHKIFMPQKNIHFSENPKNIEIENLNPNKWPEPTFVWKIRVPTPPPWVPSNICHVCAC